VASTVNQILTSLNHSGQVESEMFCQWCIKLRIIGFWTSLSSESFRIAYIVQPL
jgi:hypothetical protein